MRHVLTLLIVLSLLGGVQAQIGPGAETVYANFGDEYYLSMAATESGASGQIGITDDDPQERTIPMTPALSDGAALVQDGTLSMVLCYTGNAAAFGLVPVALVGQIDVTAEVRQGNTVIASGTAEDVLVTPQISKVPINVQAQVASIDPAAGNLEWYIKESGAASGALFIPDCEDGDWSSFSLPLDVGGGAPEVRYTNLTGDSAQVRDQFDATMNGTFVYNWTAPDEPLNLTIDLSDVAGNVTVTITDASGTLYEATHSADAVIKEQISEHGDAVQINITYESFSGDLSLDLVPAQLAAQVDEDDEEPEDPGTGDEEPAPEDQDPPQDEGQEDNGTAAPADPDQESPAAPWVLLTMALLGLVRRLRR